MRGDVTLVPGANVTMQQQGNNFTVNSINTSTTQAQVDFGFGSGNEGDSAIVTVLADWAASGSKLIAQPALVATADHDPDDIYAEEIIAYAENIIDGVSFDIVAKAPNNSWGKYKINIVGA